MSELTTTEMTPEDRAEAAARDLADRGLAVTARAVREEAGVRMAVAAATARAWKQAAAEEDKRGVTVPDVPEDVHSRLTAIWADAYRMAWATLVPERDRLAEQVATLDTEVEALTGAVTEVEAERDQATATAAARIETLEADLMTARANLQEAAAVAQARVSALEAERDRLTAHVNALIKKLPAPKAPAPKKK